MAAKFLFDLGYGEIGEPRLVKTVAELFGALVVDTRFSPRSRIPAWNREPLEALLGERYVHLRELGNRNYKSGPIEIVDLHAGLRKLDTLLARPVILMCVCRERDKCHRSVIAREFERRFHVASIPLPGELIKRLADLYGPRQAPPIRRQGPGGITQPKLF